MGFVEEGYLVKREAAGFYKVLHDADDAAEKSAIAGARFTATGAQKFQDLLQLHGGRAEIVLALLFGELEKLEKYTSPGIDAATATHGQVTSRGAVLANGALDGLNPVQKVALDALR